MALFFFSQFMNEYAEGSYAYFVDYSTETGTVDEVYFTQGNIMFQMFIPKSEAARKQAKGLLDVFAQ